MQKNIEEAVVKAVVRGLTKSGSQGSLAALSTHSTATVTSSVSKKEKFLRLPKIFKAVEDIESSEQDLDTPTTPAGSSQQLARYILYVYEAEGVPCGQFSKATNKQEQVSVQVSFGTHSAKTKVQDSDLRIAWNEQFTFIEAFPPPHSSSIWIQVCSGESTAFQSPKVIGTHVMDLSKISDDGDRGFLPTFGPAYVNLYGTKVGTGTLKKKDDATFMDSFESAAYKGRLQVALEVELLRESIVLPVGVTMSPCKVLAAEIQQDENKDFLLFGCIMDVNMLNRKLQNKPVHLEVNIGHGGDSGVGSFINEKLMERTPQVSSMTGFFSHPYKINSTTPTLNSETKGSNYCTIPYGDKKPCIFIHTKHLDFRWRIFHSNFLKKIVTIMENGLNEVSRLLDYSKERAAECFDQLLHEVIEEAGEYSKYFGNLPPFTGATRLDNEIWRVTEELMESIIQDGNKLEVGGKFNTIDWSVQSLTKLLKKFQKFSENPQDILPDIFIWLIAGDKRVAYHKISASDLLYSSLDQERGTLCSKLHCYHFRIHARKSDDEAFSKIQGQLLACFWLGLNNKRHGLLSGLPVGYKQTKEVVTIDEEHSSLPNSLLFTEKQTFELRSHLYQGKCLLPLDATGFSDPFCRIMFQGQSVFTKAMNQTLNPLWDESLVIPSVTLYGTGEHIKNNPPQVVVEILDEDLFGKDEEFMGQLMAQPQVKLHQDSYFKPKLRWYPVLRGSEHGGEVLAAFELIQVFHDGGLPSGIAELEVKTDGDSQKPIIRVPNGIRPTLSRYRFEVLFWCLRDLQRVYLQAVERPRVDIECGKVTISSEILNNYVKNPMFQDNIKTANIDLPDDPLYWPAVTIRCMDSRSFGRATIVGSAVINKLHSFMCGNTVAVTDEEDSVVPSEIDMMDSAMRAWGKPLSGAGTSAVASYIQNKGNIQKSLQLRIKCYDKAKSMNAEYQPLEDAIERVDSVFLNLGIDEDDENERNWKLKMDWWSKYYASIPNMPGQDVGDRKLAGKVEEVMEKKHSSFVRKVRRQLKKTKTFLDQHRPDCINEPKFPVEKCEVYKQEIEKQPQFEEFQDWVKTYHLHRGHRTTGLPDEKTKIGVFKGIVKICKYPMPYDYSGGLFKSVPSYDPIRVLVRIYVIRAFDLTATDYGKKADPYLKMCLGSSVIDDEDNYVPNTLNPVFGRCYELPAVFPLESQLTIQVYDKDVLSRNDFIGETIVDLENRFYSSHRGTCGLAAAYEDEGYNKWRDSLQPTEILRRYSIQMGFDDAKYGADRVVVGKKTFMLPPSKLKYFRGKQEREEAALHVLNNWNEMPEGKYFSPSVNISKYYTTR